MGEVTRSKSFTLLAAAVCLCAQQALGQINDNFSDGDFTNNPTWSGSTSNFAVNVSQQLRLNAASAGSSVLTLPFTVTAGHNTQWEFLVSHGFASSASNYSRIYLMSDSEVLGGSLNGYYIQLGENGSLDAVQLFKQAGNTSTPILRGPDGDIDQADFIVRVRVTRSSLGEWQILIDPSGGTNFTATETAIENTFTTCAFFGLRCVYTISNVSKFIFDDFAISSMLAPDVTPPQVTSVTAATANQLSINFSEALNPSVLQPTDFVLDDTVMIASAAWAEGNASIYLQLGQSMKNGLIHKITFPSVADVSGNVLNAGSQNFLYFIPIQPMKNDIIINEMYADPTPSFGLPDFEFVELFNASDAPFQLSGWQITDGTTTGTLGSKILLPGEYLIVTSNAAIASFLPFGETMGVSTFPSLNNSGDQLQLKSPDGQVINEERYNLASYQSEDKQSGGFTLERIDPTNFCRGTANWKASDHAIGGTPGSSNSVRTVTHDIEGPKFLEVQPVAANVIRLLFDERLSSVIPQNSSIQINPPITLNEITFVSNEYLAIDVIVTSPFDSATNYVVTLNNIFDCPGNILQGEYSSKTFKMDETKPYVTSVVANTPTQVDILFSEKIVDGTFTISLQDYELTDLVLSADKKTVSVLLQTPLTNGKDYSITISSATDFYSNMMETEVKAVRYLLAGVAQHTDVVITEFMADPSPAVALPEGEFVEIYNRSDKVFDLLGWTLSDGVTTSSLPSIILLPDDYLILTHQSFSSGFSTKGKVVALSAWPSLNNSGDNIRLRSAEGITIDSIHYSVQWYHDDEKDGGGWSIERLDPNDFCRAEENWAASDDESGGTPGYRNSVFQIFDDRDSPKLLALSVVAPDSIVFHFNERLESRSTNPDKFLSEITFDKISFSDGSHSNVSVQLTQKMDSVSSYKITLLNISDCSGNALTNADVTVKLDNVGPTVRSITITDGSSGVITFNEKIVLSETSRVVLDDSTIHISLRVKESTSLLATFQPPLQNGKSYKLRIVEIHDRSGNAVVANDHVVSYFVANPVVWKDVIMTEIFADPTPVLGLPEVEFVEIFNRSLNPVQLKGWKFLDDGHEVALSSNILLPQEYLILTVSSKASLLRAFGKVMGIVSFPTLTNSGETLSLVDSTGTLIDSLQYTDSWYADNESRDGGHSLELIDPDNICAEEQNWTSSTDARGGTPGAQNAVRAEKPDLLPPKVKSVFAVAADTVKVFFNEKLSEQLPTLSSFETTPHIEIADILFADQSRRSYILVLARALERRILYDLKLGAIYDCSGNVSDEQSINFALPEKAEPKDVVINEVLFNPTSTGVDFVEIYNRSEKYLNLMDWQLANFVNDTLRNVVTLMDHDFIVKPKELVVFTSKPDIVKAEYIQTNESSLVESKLPSMNDDEGSVFLLSSERAFVDSLFYSDDQHSPFLKDPEGVSLERINPELNTNMFSNWHSASGTSGFATPGNLNSSYTENIADQQVSVEPEVFIPQSGQPNYTLIAYNLDRPGFVANVRIVNAQGRVIKTVCENQILGSEGFFTWDGDSDSQTKVPIGAYMVWIELFDIDGRLRTVKKRVAVAERF